MNFDSKGSSTRLILTVPLPALAPFMGEIFPVDASQTCTLPFPDNAAVFDCTLSDSLKKK
jgi:hypothetical protein